jgi:hypothetical protein
MPSTVPLGMALRYRCNACGNLTRFDVVATRRSRAFHHFSVGGALTVEEEVLLDEVVEQVTCRWCGGSKAIEVLPLDEGALDEGALDHEPAVSRPAG